MQYGHPVKASLTFRIPPTGFEAIHACDFGFIAAAGSLSRTHAAKLLQLRKDGTPAPTLLLPLP
jgi:hypothetical protein